VDGWSLGESLLIRLLGWLIIGPIPDGYAIELSSTIFAGWVGLLVTMLNLLPLGQLDGGHIIYGLFGKMQYRISSSAGVLVAGMVVFWRAGLFVRDQTSADHQ